MTARLCLLLLLAFGSLSWLHAQETEVGEGARAQTERPQEQGEEPQTMTSQAVQSAPNDDLPEYPDPNTIPYKSRKSVLVHFFSLPAKVWHLTWTPLGATVIWVEQNRVQEKALDFFLNDARTGGFFPLVSLGGNTGAGAGLMVFHNNLFNKRKSIQASFLYNTSENHHANLTYSDSSLFGSSFYFDVTGEYFRDSDENLFIADNISQQALANSSIAGNSTEVSDETSYATKQADVLANFGYAITRKIGLGIASSFSHADIDSGTGVGGGDFPDVIPGSEEVDLFSVGGALTFNYSNGWPRTLSGSLFRVGYSYNRQVNGSLYAFNRFTAEVQQFMPIPFLAKNRRLAVRGIFEKIDRHGDKQVPFYALSVLGDASNLRGYDQNRFRGRGALLFNFEYRYPIWDTWDAVIFLDEGQVFDDLGDIEFSEFHSAVGAGVRFMSPNGFAMRVELARSSEEWRALFQIAPNF